MVSLVIPQSALQSWFRPERIARFSKVANLLLVIWLAWLAAKLTWQLVPQAEQTEPAVTFATVPVRPQRLPRIGDLTLVDTR